LKYERKDIKEILMNLPSARFWGLLAACILVPLIWKIPDILLAIKMFMQ